MKLERLDDILVRRGICACVEQARAQILAGNVFCRQGRADKAGMRVARDIEIEVRDNKMPFVSRGGLKLAHGLDVFKVSASGRTCLDVGASTGGFTDCLLQRGARRVVAVDVAYGKLDYRLRSDPRVVVVERVNARELSLGCLPSDSVDSVSLAVIDVSFISLGLIVPNIQRAFPTIEEWVCLFKPQFEVPRKFVLAGGIVKDLDALEVALGRIQGGLESSGLRQRHAPVKSPIAGKRSGNVEYLLHYGVS